MWRYIGTLVRLWLFVLCFKLFYLSRAVVNATDQSSPEKVFVRLRNDGEVRMQVGWINLMDGSVHDIGTIEPFGTFHMNSFSGHMFELLELPSPVSGRCEIATKGGPVGESLEIHEGCAMKTIHISKTKEQNLVVTETLQIRNDDIMDTVYSSQTIEQPELLGMCRFEAKRKLIKARNGGHSKAAMNGIVDQFYECFRRVLAPILREKKNEMKFEERVLKTVSTQLENFTCTGDLEESSPDVDTRDWIDEKDNIQRRVHVKLDRPATQIHVVEDFASVEECKAMEEDVANRLGVATTEDGKGGARISNNRKAMQAYIEPDWTKETEADPILRLDRRIFDYTNHVLGLNISAHGQEPLMSIQYFGRGSSDHEPDRYTPHCDGKCEGEPLVHASRMATMVIYCTVPERGGHTNFQTAGVTVKPSVGSGIFFSYIDPLTNTTDRGFSRHSGCPVYDGQKKIITQWIRLGVNADVTYEAYNSLEVLISEGGE